MRAVGVENRDRRRRGIVAAMASDLAGAFRYGSRVERACYLVAAGLFLSGLFHLGVLVVTGGSWSGPLSWRKPATFGLSFGLTLATITWVLHFVPWPRRASVLMVFGAACVTEVAVITIQAWRGLPSHFPPQNGGGVVGVAAAPGAVVIIVTMLLATVAAWRRHPQVSPSIRLALRAGFGSLMVALLLGAYMLARGMVIARAMGDTAGAFEFTAGIKPGHAATMHGVLVLPALAWLLRFTDRDERFRLSVVRAVSAGYAVLAGVVVVASLTGMY